MANVRAKLVGLPVQPIAKGPCREARTNPQAHQTGQNRELSRWRLSCRYRRQRPRRRLRRWRWLGVRAVRGALSLLAMLATNGPVSRPLVLSALVLRGVAGTPPRITKLELADRGLAGEMRGWLGDLGELVELRLERNRLTGVVPSKLTQLSKLTHAYLGGNSLEGCLPASLRSVPHSDVAALGLSDCAYGGADQQTFKYFLAGSLGAVVYDIPPGTTISFTQSGCVPSTYHPPCVNCLASLSQSHECGTAIALHGRGVPPDTWIFWFRDGGELERSHYQLDGQPGTLLTQVSASTWRTSLKAVGLR